MITVFCHGWGRGGVQPRGRTGTRHLCNLPCFFDGPRPPAVTLSLLRQDEPPSSALQVARFAPSIIESRRGQAHPGRLRAPPHTGAGERRETWDGVGRARTAPIGAALMPGRACKRRGAARAQRSLHAAQQARPVHLGHHLPPRARQLVRRRRAGTRHVLAVQDLVQVLAGRLGRVGGRLGVSGRSERGRRKVSIAHPHCRGAQRTRAHAPQAGPATQDGGGVPKGRTFSETTADWGRSSREASALSRSNSSSALRDDALVVSWSCGEGRGAAHGLTGAGRGCTPCGSNAPQAHPVPPPPNAAHRVPGCRWAGRRPS